MIGLRRCLLRPPLLLRAGLLLLAGFALWSASAEADGNGRLLGETAVEARDHYIRALAEEDPALREAHLRKAAEAYRVLAGQGVDNRALWTNLGHCYLRLEEPGRASVAYLRALERNPRTERAESGLLQARSLARLGPSPREAPDLLKTAFFFHYRLSRLEAAWAMAVLWATAGLLGAAALRFRRRVPGVVAVLLLLLALVMAGSLAWRHRQGARTGIVVAPEADLRSGPAESFPVIVRMKEAARLRIVEARAGWVRVVFDDDQRAWIRAADLEEV